ncbi:MAG TPA: diacylglycerol kinase family lipid kinase [Bacteroidales bacterium]|nr:diacylglycerol kinase family lipid kinase [Bacteroidales bacterium]HPT02737.1 diacylglycerol kinase family lipid kinase [Bacteroidales bacterium]
MAGEKKKVLFIINPKAGITPKIEALLRLHVSLLFGNGNETSIVFTKYPHHATELSEKAIEDHYDIIVAGGGDGTINEVATALFGTGVPMGILPFGSGNGLARHLGIPLNLIHAMRVIARGNTRLIDTVQLNDRIFTSIAGIGFDAVVAEKFDKSDVRGLLSYTAIILKDYRRYTCNKYRLLIDGQSIEREALMISFANSNQFGFHARIAPQASSCDGWLDICIIRKPSLIKAIFFAAPRIFFGTLGKTNYAEYFRARTVEIPGTAGSVVNIDGEPARIDNDLKLEVKPLTLNVIVP